MGRLRAYYPVSLFDRMATDPVPYALRILAGLILLAVVAGWASAQTEFQVTCRDGYCVMREADIDRIQGIINALVDRIETLQRSTGCT